MLIFIIIFCPFRVTFTCRLLEESLVTWNILLVCHCKMCSHYHNSISKNMCCGKGVRYTFVLCNVWAYVLHCKFNCNIIGYNNAVTVPVMVYLLISLYFQDCLFSAATCWTQQEMKHSKWFLFSRAITLSLFVLHSNMWLSLLLTGLIVSDIPYSLNYF